MSTGFKRPRECLLPTRFPKLGSRTFNLPSWPGNNFSIAGITKGAGMIHPNMATTLGSSALTLRSTPLPRRKHFL